MPLREELRKAPKRPHKYSRPRKVVVIPRPIADPPQDVRTALAWIVPLGWKRKT